MSETTQFLLSHHLLGITIGLATFLVIGLFHPLVIKSHYYFGIGSRWAFIVLGLIGGAASLMVSDFLFSTVLGVVAFSSFWSFGEILEQERRVARGWFPANPRRKKS
ncbi:MAG: DUF4491 family protein [Duncaniella sp.]|nr:DUF4491 family protein [Duncaniella sp.]